MRSADFMKRDSSDARRAAEWTCGHTRRQPLVDTGCTAGMTMASVLAAGAVAGEREMDKLRSLQYFVAAAEEKSLAGAARRFGVSTQAVAKMITALERDLGVDRSTAPRTVLSLTASGAAYRETCLPALSQLQLADELVRATPAQGGVVAGVQHVIARQSADAGFAALSRAPPADSHRRARLQPREQGS
jgi:DNA-binding MarR family transcriptional regulator